MASYGTVLNLNFGDFLGRHPDPMQAGVVSPIESRLLRYLDLVFCSRVRPNFLTVSGSLD